jgi:hypothetical protein
MYQPIHPRSPLETMPTIYDLPGELIGESGLPDESHCNRPLAELRLRGRNRGFSSSKSNFKVINGSNQITT